MSGLDAIPVGEGVLVMAAPSGLVRFGRGPLEPGRPVRNPLFESAVIGERRQRQWAMELVVGHGLALLRYGEGESGAATAYPVFLLVLDDGRAVEVLHRPGPAHGVARAPQALVLALVQSTDA